MTTGNYKTVKASVMRHEYWLINPGRAGHVCKTNIGHDMIYGFSVLRDGMWSKVGGYQKEGYKIYKFHNPKSGTMTTVVVQSKQECFRFAAWCYDTISANEWQKVSLK